MSGNGGQSQSMVKEAKCQLLSHIIWHSEQGEEIWDRLVSEQQSCAHLIAQQAIVSEKFSEYHDLWQDRNVDDILNFHRFTEIDEEVTSQADLLEHFEPRSLKANDTIMECLQAFSDSRKYLDEMREYIMKCTDLDQLNSINLDDFEWINPNSMPDTFELTEEWNYMDLYQRISSLVGEMYEINNAGENSDGSSSSLAEVIGIFDN